MPTFKRLAWLAVFAPAAAQATTPVIAAGDFVTKAASAQQAALCPAGKGYPAQKVWNPITTVAKPLAATSGTRKIEQYRAGKLIATYTSFDDKPGCTYKLDGTDYLTPGPPAASGCGPFTHSLGWRLWEPKDIFYVYPAVYSGQYNNFALDTEYDGPKQFPNQPVNPSQIFIIGVTQNNVRPVIQLNVPATHNALYQAAVYFGSGNNNYMTNIDVVETAGGSAGTAGIYISGMTNLILRNMRISGFEQSGLNGIFVATAAGTLLLDQLEVYDNGGLNSGNNNALSHNIYANASATDANFNLMIEHSWLHDAFMGDLVKSRAQTTTAYANYFQGGLPQPGKSVAETYLLDVPNGGVVVAKDNVFAKNATGAAGNGASVTFNVEGIVDSRTQSLDIENNTFVAWSAFWNGTDYNWPFFFFSPAVVPGTSEWPSTIPYRIIKNAFVGYCRPQGDAEVSYRGSIDAQEAFSELTPGFSLVTKIDSADAYLTKTLPNYKSIYNFMSYFHADQPNHVRKATTLGAED